MINNESVFITGGAGFIGGAIARRLAHGNDITLFDNMARRSRLVSELIQDYPDRVSLIEGDVRDGAGLVEAIERASPTIIVHCAAVAGIDTVIKSPISTLETNLLGTSHVLKACTKLKRLKRCVIFSTSEVFGQRAFNSSEQSAAVIGAVGEARWTYAVSKLAGEHLAHAYYSERGVPSVVLRPFNVYGPGQIGEGALSIFIQNALLDQPIEVHNDGTQIRAWCYVDDMVSAVTTCIEHPKAIGESFNIGNARAVTTIFGLANAVVRTLNSKSKIVFSPRDQADVELRIPNVVKARSLIGFEARVSLEEGILATAEYYRRMQPRVQVLP